jgi:hypothetical protein
VATTPAAPTQQVPVTATEPTQQFRPVAEQAASAPATAFPAVRIVAMAGGAVVAVAGPVPWLRTPSVSGFDVPFLAIFGSSAADALRLGLVLLVIGVLGAGLSAAAPLAPVRRSFGSLVFLIVGTFATRLVVDAFDAGADLGDVLSVVGLGPYVALAGAVLLMFGPAGRARGR